MLVSNLAGKTGVQNDGKASKGGVESLNKGEPNCKCVCKGTRNEKTKALCGFPNSNGMPRSRDPTEKMGGERGNLWDRGKGLVVKHGMAR